MVETLWEAATRVEGTKHLRTMSSRLRKMLCQKTHAGGRAKPAEQSKQLAVE